jgi:hypothetical protein
MSIRSAQLSFLDAAVARRGRRNDRLEAFAAALVVFRATAGSASSQQTWGAGLCAVDAV